jgi:hypothetical protein
MSEWQPISTAPRQGAFLAYRPRVKGPCVVKFLYSTPYTPRNMVICIETGKCWIADWWMPMPPPPKPA